MKRPVWIFLLPIIITLLVTPVFSGIGEQLDIEVFVNNSKVDTPVYKNTSAPPVQGDNFFPVYVDLILVFEKLGASIKFNGPDVIYITGERPGNIKIVVGKSTYRFNDSSFTGKYVDYSSLINETTYVGERVFIPLSYVRYIIDGSLRQEENAVYLYSSDFERLDIPATLEECFEALDRLLDDNDKIEFARAPEEQLGMYHFSLGLWIRNNWIRPSKTRIAKLFFENGIYDPDSMSHIIIVSYHRYLNRKEINFNEQIKQ